MRHGHVIPNPDGTRARCGGPAICAECARELAALKPDGHVHVVPRQGRQHVEDSRCWCEPELREDYTADGGKKLFVHREPQ